MSKESTALVVVDVQEAAVSRGPYRGDAVIENIRTLMEACRDAGVEVVHVQHDGKPGEAEEPGTPGWQIHAAVRPQAGERVIRKQTNSAFKGTDLREYLEGRGVQTLILVGIQTEYCLDTSLRVAFEYGFDVVVPELTNTTYDNGDITAEQIYEMYNHRIFDGRFAAVRSMAETLEAVSRGGVFS